MTCLAVPMLMLVELHAPGALAQPPLEDFCITDGRVHAVVSDGARFYIGGDFTYVGPATGSGVPIHTVSAMSIPGFPKVLGWVFAVAPDGAGGWYLGGEFTQVGTKARYFAAHVAGDLSVSEWNPNPNGRVLDIEVNGSTVYLAGEFTTVGSLVRNHVAAVNAASFGAVRPWNPNVIGVVRALVTDDSTVFMGGEFTSVGGVARNNLAEVDKVNGTCTAWNPDAQNGVGAMAAGDSVIYVGGAFSLVGGQQRHYLAAIDSRTGVPTGWNPMPNALVAAIAVGGSSVYVSGYFSGFGGYPSLNPGLAALDKSTGLPTAWNPQLETYGFVNSIAVDGDVVYVGGMFGSVGGRRRKNLAALDALTGDATAWEPGTDDRVLSVAIAGTTLFAGGTFGSAGGRVRGYLAALDAATGSLTDWNPDPSWRVNALILSGSRIYAGGDFPQIGGRPIQRLAAIDLATSEVYSWNPNPNGSVHAIAVAESAVYVGGWFTSIGGQARNCIAALDIVSGAATPWNPNPPWFGRVGALAVADSVVFAGGVFEDIGGQHRQYIAALSAKTGAATSWDPSANAPVYCLAAEGSSVFAGGQFSVIGGRSRQSVAELDAGTGLATAWDASVGPTLDAGTYVRALVVRGPKIYVGGSFSTIGEQARRNLAALDRVTGSATSWAPVIGGTIWSVATRGSTVCAAGDGLFSFIDDVPTPVIASVVAATPFIDRVELTWEVGFPATSIATIYRDEPGGDWRAIGTRVINGTGRVAFTDYGVSERRRIGYRLGFFDGAFEVLAGEVWVEIPRVPSLALHWARAKAGTGVLATSFDLTLAAPATLALFDTEGRRLAACEVGMLGPGTHTVDLAPRRPLASGVYWVRLAQGDRVATAKAVVLH